MTLYLASLTLTLVIETAIALLALPRHWRRLVLDVPLASLLTHPLATFLFLEGGVPLLVVEAGVVLVEAAVFRVVTGLDGRRALLLSMVINGVTTALALVWGAL